MDTFYIVILTALFFLNANLVNSISECLPGCTCTNDRYGRSLLCMETTLRSIPENIPQDLIKIRIENSHLTEIPRGPFSKVSALEYLWLNFNDITLISAHSLEGLYNLTELRLQGNKLRSVPWTAFQNTSNLKILDLKHNRLDVLPEYALKHLPSLTFLDLSFNQLTVISKEVFLNWPLYLEGEEHGNGEGVTSNVVLALHDNPWVCDCRLRGFVQLIKSLSPSIILMNSYLICAGPELRAGKFFHEVELKTCMKPVATATITNTTLPLGANITLVCLAKARPNPAVWWTYGLKIIRGFNESQTVVDEDTVRSELTIPSLHLADRGVYTCTAFNFIGNASVSVMVKVESADAPFPPFSAFHLSPVEEDVRIDVRIARQTVRGITLEWEARLARPAEAWYTLHWGRTDTSKKSMIYIAPGTNSYSLTDLAPATKYEICVALRSQAPRGGQCLVFVTGSEAGELGQRGRMIHILVVFCSLVLVVPVGMYLCTLQTRFSCFDRSSEPLGQRNRGKSPDPGEGRGTFDSLQVITDQDPCRDTDMAKAKSGGPTQKPKTDHPSTAVLY